MFRSSQARQNGLHGFALCLLLFGWFGLALCLCQRDEAQEAGLVTWGR